MPGPPATLPSSLRQNGGLPVVRTQLRLVVNRVVQDQRQLQYEEQLPTIYSIKDELLQILTRPSAVVTDTDFTGLCPGTSTLLDISSIAGR